MSKNDLVDIACGVKIETESAWGISDGTAIKSPHTGKVTEKITWIPKSLGEWDKDTETMAMPEWLAIKEGLI